MSVVVGRGTVADWNMRDWEHRLCGDPTTSEFSAAEVDTLPEPVQRYFNAAIAVGTPLATRARFRMRGHIKVGRRLPSKPGKFRSMASGSSGLPVPPASSPVTTDTSAAMVR